MSEENFKVRTPWFPLYSDVRMLLTLFQGVSKAAVKRMVSAIYEQTGTPQNPVDWSSPDTWIVERLHGNDAQLAQHIWQDSHHTVNPRYIPGTLFLIHMYELLVTDVDGIFHISVQGQLFLENDPQTVREIDEAEGILQLLTILATKSQAKRSDLLPEWGDFLHAHSRYGTEATIIDTLRRRLVNLVERRLVLRMGNAYTISPEGLAYVTSGSNEEAKIGLQEITPKQEVSLAVEADNDQKMRSRSIMQVINMPVVTSDQEELKFEGDEGEERLALTVPEEKRTIRTKSADPEIDSLYGKFKRGKLTLQPNFQRLFVWDRTKASRLIESALLDVPIPIIYLSEETDGRELVIDGQQRLTSFFSFFDGIFPDKKPFRLTGLRVLDELNNKSYKELSETLQDKIRYYQIRAITILYDSHPDLKFEIFERLNTGAVPLNDMELRNCIYHGEYMELLRLLARDTDFRQILSLKEADSRMHDVELVLRFAAFYHATYLKYQPPMKRFLNRDMEKFRHITKEEADELRTAFKSSVQIVKSLFGTSAFKRFYGGTKLNPNGNWETKQFNASLYDVMMGVFWNKDRNSVYAVLDSLREGFIDLMVSNEQFVDAILIGTSEQGKVRKRFLLADTLVDDILQSYKKQPRLFTLEFKKELFARNQTCAICHQQINSMDDAAVDHIQQYWKGGKTIPENARLTHRYCNLSRPRNE